MYHITRENSKMLQYSSLFLLFSGIAIGVTGYLGQNYASLFLGFSFALLCLVCYLLIKASQALWAKLLWAFVTPLLIFISPCLFTLQQPMTIVSYSFAYIGALMYSTYTFRGQAERKFLWAAVAVSFMCYMTYDRFMIAKSFHHSEYVKIFIDHYWYFKLYQALHFVSMVYLIYRIDTNKTAIEESLVNRIGMLQKFVANLISTSKNSLVHAGDLNKALQEILVHTTSVMDVSRMSVWEYDEERKTIRLLAGYDSIQETFFDSPDLKQSDYPTYFNSLLEEKIIMAEDAAQDKRTREFKDTYLLPLGIKSMMDAPFFVDGKFKGIVCCEEQRNYRSWDQLEQLFSLSISKLISISYYCTLRKEQYDQLIKTSNQLAFQTQTIQEVSDKFRQMNTLKGSLDHALEGNLLMQKTIEDMSFKNAHDVRGPLSRILGLVSLYKIEPNEENKQLYMRYIEQSAHQLDEVIREISNLLNGDDKGGASQREQAPPSR